MRLRACVVACGCVGALLLGACGRLGFELLDRDGDGPSPRADGGNDRDAQVGGSGGRAPGSMDAAVDAAIMPATDGGNLADAAADAAPPLDAGSTEEDAGTDPPDPPDAGGCMPATVTDYCTALPPLPAAPQIDGVLDCGPPLRDLTPRGWTSMMTPLPASVSARIAAAWRPDGVYLFLDVTDDTRLPRPAATGVWCGDGIELYVDDDGTYAAAPMYDAPGTIQLLAIAPANDTDSVTTGGERYRSPNGGLLVGPWSSPRYGAFPRPGGYTFEAFIMADDLDLGSWTLAAGQSVGLDLSINVSTSADPPPSGEMAECGLRLGQYFLRVLEQGCGNMCAPFVNAEAFCNPVLQ